MKIGGRTVKLNTKISHKYNKPEEVPFWKLYVVEVIKEKHVSTFKGETVMSTSTHNKVIFKYPDTMTLDEMELLIKCFPVGLEYKYHAYPRTRRSSK